MGSLGTADGPRFLWRLPMEYGVVSIDVAARSVVANTTVRGARGEAPRSTDLARASEVPSRRMMIRQGPGQQRPPPAREILIACREAVGQDRTSYS